MSTISLCVICKNELNNFPKLLASIKDCFDEIHVTDTGSTDGTLELLERYKHTNPANAPLYVHHFDWVNDFSAARNYSFSHAKTDYIMWLDLDDVLDSSQNFKLWRAACMDAVDFWVATYHYGGIDSNGVSSCKFMRERVIKNNGQFEWKFFVHEGLIPKNPAMTAQYVTNWSVIHQRTADDMKKDRSRNLKLFENRKPAEMPPRMVYYYGKELFENNQPLEAFPNLLNAAKEESLEPHDRIMALQYACLASMHCGQLDKAIQLAFQGLQLAPNRAEFHIVVADCLVKQQKLAEAIPFYSSAKACKKSESLHAEANFTHVDSYMHYPRNQLARCYFHTNQMDFAKEALDEALRLGPHVETAQLMTEFERISKDLTIREADSYEKVPEIVFSCIPNIVKDWDGDSLKTKGLGGSETAVIHMARELHELTGLNVRVFNERKDAKVVDGVSYEPLSSMYTYFRDKMPAVHIAWRHNIKLSPAPMYIWCHDLAYVGIENGHDYDKIFVLSEFHKNWMMSLYKVPESKILITRNGLDLTRFNPTHTYEKGHKVIYSSSADRGLERAIRVMDHVVKEVPDAELHVYYGMDLMRSGGKAEEANKLDAMMAQRPWVKNHGNIPQKELTREFETASVWLYPTNFLETYCITAIECLSTKTYPIVRKFGALPYTLREAAVQGMADIIDSDCVTPEQEEQYARAVVNALKEEKWKGVMTLGDYSWKSVASEWVNLLPLPKVE